MGEITMSSAPSRHTWRASLFAAGLLVAGLCGPVALHAQAPSAPAADSTGEIRREIEDLKRQYQERIDALEKRLADLEARPGGGAAPPASATPPTPVPEAPAPEAAAPPPPTPSPETASAVGAPAGGEAA